MSSHSSHGEEGKISLIYSEEKLVRIFRVCFSLLDIFSEQAGLKQDGEPVAFELHALTQQFECHFHAKALSVISSWESQVRSS